MSFSKYCTKAQVERTTIEWTIENFSLLLEAKGTAIESPFFYSENKKEEWKIHFYPRGSKKSLENEIFIFLYLSSGTLPLNIQYEGSIIQSGTVVEEYTNIREYNSLKGRGHANFVERSRLLGHATDTFTISFKIDKSLGSIVTSLTNSPMAMARELSVDTKTGQLAGNFAELLKNPKLSDITIIVEDKKFLVHKIILIARSPVFALMFENKEMDGNGKNVIEIENMEPSVVKGMLEFIYTDNVSNFEEISNGLLSAADKYNLVRLKALCEESLAKTLSDETAVEILVLADLHHADHLKKHVMQFMENHLADIINSEGFEEIEKKYPELLHEFIHFMALQKETKKISNLEERISISSS